MIDDIVELPRPLKGRSCETVLSSYRPYEPPASEFGRMLGISVDIRDMPICIGNEFELLTGNDSPHRYKLVEHDEKFVREFVTISDGPITSVSSKLFTLWVNQVNKQTLECNRYYFWDMIAAAREYYGFQKCDLLSREVEDTLKVAGTLRSYPGLERSYQWSHEHLEPVKDEVEEVDRMFMLHANIGALDDAMDCNYFFNPTDVFRGAWKDTKPIKLITGAGRILSHDIVAPKDVKKLLGPDYATKPYHMCLREVKPLHEETHIDTCTECSGWFDVLKYVELIPYSELFVTFTNQGIDVMRVYDPYDREHTRDIKIDQLDEKTRVNFTKLREELNEVLPPFTRGSIYRSWGEEVYITIQNQYRQTKRYYFDMVYAALGSRMFTPSEKV